MPNEVPAPDVTISHTVLRELARGGDLISSVWTAVAVGALAVALVVVLVLRRRRHRRSWPWAVGAGTATVLALAVAANAIAGYVPNVQSLQTTLSGWGLAPAPRLSHGTATPVSGGPGQGASQAFHVPSHASLDMPTKSITWVYTPPGYNGADATRYPVVYLIHGSPGASGDWFAAGDAPHAMDVLLSAKLVQPMIVVSVDVNGTGATADDTECLDSTRGGSQVETYLTTVVVPWVDSTFATRADAAHRVLGGFSSGGFCALDQGLRHPDLWGTFLALAPYPTPGDGGHAMLATHAQWLTHDVTAYASTVTIDPGQHMFIAVDAESTAPAVDAVRTIAQTLRARGADVVLDEVSGVAHTWTMARSRLPYGLVWASGRIPTG
ncbi:MAG: hypothetical protein KJ792_12510 [Actinobacteria bacterium]|nr:hypothetical protein [Actinomycetota bacterium]